MVGRRIVPLVLVFVFVTSMLAVPGACIQAKGETPPSVCMLNVPYHVQQTEHWCGYACLEMVFDYYGVDIPQSEIVAVEGLTQTNTLPAFVSGFLPEAQFSNLSTSATRYKGHLITGYIERGLGYVAFRYTSDTPWLDQLKTLIAAGYPVMVHTWFDLSETAPHWRVVIGYDDINQQMILNDPWGRGKSGYAPGEMGPDEHISYTDFVKLWSITMDFNSPYNAVLVTPWSVSVNAPSSVVAGSTFAVKVTVTYNCPAPFDKTQFPASLTETILNLPSGFTMAAGENATKDIGLLHAGDVVKLSWKVVAANKPGQYGFSIQSGGVVSGFDAYGVVYSDVIGGEVTATIAVVH